VVLIDDLGTQNSTLSPGQLCFRTMCDTVQLQRILKDTMLLQRCLRVWLVRIESPRIQLSNPDACTRTTHPQRHDEALLKHCMLFWRYIITLKESGWSR
jgi:hypothetical protein